ncbi:M20 family metallopeptidase [Shimazuella kribbensis]|uniref:M20 family metallopeptidase n=1 Tax=Shimazuella kribbensis TaxID=139808 RepID=UPI0004005D64|nr:M20 family metallopeptidase [Shimazuella kribbensis]
MDFREKLSQIIDEKREMLIDVSDQIWDYAETGFEEVQSVELLCNILQQEGFTVEKGVGGIETAFIGTFGESKPNIAILGEFDALSGLSQQGGLAQAEPVQLDGNGHGCGHNLLGTGALAAAIALRYYMEEHHIPGTIRYYGCPGEEIGAGKTFMVRAGLFDDVDFALTWHPGTQNGVMSMSSLACYEVSYRFMGKSSHAGVTPHLGRSALDAVELMNVGVNYLREHIIPEARVHYATTNTGGISPNVVQAEAEVLYLIRAPKVAQTEGIYQRICNIARGAALMTGTEVEIIFQSALSDLIPNKTLETIMHHNMTELGVPVHNQEEIVFARDIRYTLSEEDKEADIRDIPELKGKEISDMLLPYKESSVVMPGSTDVGDVSWVVPTAQCWIACDALGTPFHTWQMVAQGKTSIAHKGMLHAGKVIASTAIDIMQDLQIIEKARLELIERLGGETYQSPIPKEVTHYILRLHTTKVVGFLGS